MKLFRKALAPILLGLASVTLAGEPNVRDLVAKGEAVSYEVLEAAISRQFHGRIIRVELEREWSGWYYELRLLQDDGRVVEIELHAKTLIIKEIEGERLETVVKRKP